MKTPLGAAGLLGAGILVLGCGRGNFAPAPGFGSALASAGYAMPAMVRCPSAVPAVTGTVFHCTFTNPDGASYDARATVTAVAGTRVDYHVVIDRQLRDAAPIEKHRSLGERRG